MKQSNSVVQCLRYVPKPKSWPLAASGILLSSALILAVADPVFAGSDARQTTTNTSASSRVFIDPETGERRLPTVKERAEMSVASDAQIPQPELIERDGMRILVMPPERRVFLHGTVDESGAVQLRHQQGASNE